MADSFLDVDQIQLGTPTYAEAPLEPITSGLPTLGAYSTNLNLEKPTSILPALLSSTFNIPSINLNAGNIIGDAKESVSDLKLPSFDQVEEEAKKEGLDPVEWVDENIVKPIDQTVVRPVDEVIEEQLVDPTTGFIKNMFQPVEGFIGNLDDYLDEKFAEFTTPEVLEELQAAGGEYLGGAESINDFLKNPNSATALEFVKGIDRIYATATGSSTPQTITMPEIDIEGTGVTGGEEIQVSNILSPEAVKNFQSVAGVYNIANYIDNPTIEGAAAAYGDLLHLSAEYSPEVYEILGADTAANVVGELANIVKVIDAVEALEGGIDGIGEALTVTSGISAGAAAATSLGIATEGGIVSQIGGLAGPLAIASLAHMAYQLTKDQDFPRAFASIEYDSEYTYQSGYYGYKDELNPSSSYHYALDELTGKNFGGYGPFKFGEGRAIDGGSRDKTDNSLMTAQEFANWIVTGLGYEVDEAAFKKFAEDGSNFVGDGDVGYLQAKHGLKGIKTNGYDLIADMIKKGVFVSTDDTIALDPEDWKTSLNHLKDSQNNPNSFLYKKLADISDPLTGELREEIDSIKNSINTNVNALFERREELEQNPDLAAEEVKNSYIQGIFDAEGSTEQKISAIEGILATDTQTLLSSSFDATKAMTDAYQFENLGIPDDPYTRTMESMQFKSGPSPFGFYGTLPYIG